jgi:gliding motility-associated-like protein
VIVNAIGGPQILSVNSTDATCGSDNGSIAISALGTGILFSIDNGSNWSTDSTFTNLAAGSYFIQVKDSNCMAPYVANPVIIGVLNGPQIISVISINTTCGLSNGSISISASGSNLMFSINNGTTWQTDSVFLNLSAGSYTIRVKDSTCEVPYINNPVIISTTAGPQITEVEVTNATCGINNGSITITASGTGTILYSINNGYTWLTSNLFSNLAPGSYYIKVKDDNCEVTYPNNPVIVSTTGGPQIISVIASDATCGQNNGTISITASGSGNLQYSIDNGATWQTSGDFFNLAAGSYLVKVKDDYCETVYPANPVVVNTIGGPQILSVLATDATCGQDNGSIIITATGSGTLLYSIDDGANWQAGGQFGNLAAGSYLIRVKDDYCESIYPANPVVVNTIGGPEIISVNTTDATCGQDNGSINITATGTGTILYSIDDGANWQASGQFMNLAPGSYLIRIKDDHCEIIYPNNPVLLNSISGPMITLVGPTNTTCGNDNGTISILASGGDSLMFSIDNGASWTSDSVFTNLPVGLYNILVKNKICITSFINNPVSISAIPVPEITSLSAIDPRCHNGSDGYAIVNVSGGTQPYSYAWNDPMNQVSAQATNLKAGIFSVVITDASGCQDSASVVISEPDSAMLSNIWITNNTCYGDHNGSIHVEVSGGAGPYTFTWANGFTGNHLENLAAGSYRLLVTDSRGCTFDTIIEVLQPDQLIAYATITSPIIVMGGSATIQVSGTGGTGPYSGTGTYFVNAGTYSFQITDSTGCLATASISVPDAGKVLTNDTSACLGDHIVLPLIVYNFEDIVLFHLNLMYNPNIMEFAGFRSVIPDLNTGLMIHPVAGAGTLTMDWSQSFSVTLPDSSQLLQLVFKAINPGTTKIGVYDTVSGQNRFVNSLNQLINVQYVQGKAEVIRPAVVEIIGANTVNYGQPLELMVMAWTGNPIAYEWTSPGGEHSDSYSFRIDQFLEQHEGFYSIKVLDYNGCLSGDTTFISLGVRQVGRIEVPNAFTPNNDGLNDSFLAYTNLDIKFDFKMLVFNKWGELIFESNDIAKGWDGTYKGAECQQDLYTWIIHFGVPDYIQMEQQSPMKGVVMLVK